MVLQVVAWAILAGPFGTLIAIALLVPRSAGATHIEATTGQHSELTRLELLHGSLLTDAYEFSARTPSVPCWMLSSTGRKSRNSTLSASSPSVMRRLWPPP